MCTRLRIAGTVASSLPSGLRDDKLGVNVETYIEKENKKARIAIIQSMDSKTDRFTDILPEFIVIIIP